ncbi:UpxY family transcription antiterminator [Flavobacteriales bacterium]|nr:UpxY family transcription antiterminator [Flavobacteriales bacterium]
MKHNNNNDWFVLCTKARQELKVLERLTHLGIKAYTPTKIEVRKWSDRKKKIQTCLLPSMILVCLQESEINKVFEVPGVKRYLFFNGVRAVVLDHEVLAMKSFIKNTYQLFEDNGFGIGDYVKINSLDQDARIIALNGKNCIARLKMLGATISFQLN